MKALALALVLASAASSGYADPSLLDEVIDVLESGQDVDLVAQKILAAGTSGDEFLTPVGDMLALLRSPRFLQLGKNVACNANNRNMWYPESASIRKSDGFIDFLRSANMVEYYDTYGWPDVCANEGPETEWCH